MAPKSRTKQQTEVNCHIDGQDRIAQALQNIAAIVGATSRQLSDLRQRRAAERAAFAAEDNCDDPFEQDSDCSICYEPLDRPHAVITACGHIYHRVCIATALDTSKQKCPICRRHVHHAELVQIMNGLPTKRMTSYTSTSASISVQVDSNQEVVPCKRPRLSPSGTRLDSNTDDSERSSVEQKRTDLDLEIVETLQCGRNLLTRLRGLQDIENCLQQELDEARLFADRVRRECESEKETLLASVGARYVSLKAQEQTLEKGRQSLLQDRELLQEQLNAAQRRAGELSKAIEKAEKAKRDAEHAQAENETSRTECEQRKQRYQALLKSMQKGKAKSDTAEKQKSRELEEKNRELEKMIENLRNNPGKQRSASCTRPVNVRRQELLTVDASDKRHAAKPVQKRQHNSLQDSKETECPDLDQLVREHSIEDIADKHDVDLAADRVYSHCRPFVHAKGVESMSENPCSTESRTESETCNAGNRVSRPSLSSIAEGADRTLCNRLPLAQKNALRPRSERQNACTLAEFVPEMPKPVRALGAIAARNVDKQPMCMARALADKPVGKRSAKYVHIRKVDSYFK